MADLISGVQIMDLVELTQDPSEDHDTEDSVSENPTLPADETRGPLPSNFVLGFTSDSMTLRMMHPAPDQILGLWKTFKGNIAVVVKSVHPPTMERYVQQAINDLTSLDDNAEALMFSIYYISTLTLTSNDTLTRFGFEKQKALDRFRFATEQALARGGFLLSQNMLLLQAFHLYISTLARDNGDSHLPTMVSLLVNIAQSMGLHRDGEQFNLPPFETEMRRRLWWAVRTIGKNSTKDANFDLPMC